MTAAPLFRLVIFDLDGTLVDSLPDIAWALNSALMAAGLPPCPRSTVAEFIGDGAAKLIERAVRACSHRPMIDAPVATLAGPHPFTTSPAGEAGLEASLLSRFTHGYAARICAESRLYPGIVELLTGLTNAGVATAVVTNKRGSLARELVAAIGIADRFSAIIGDGDGYMRKPDPAAARAIIQKHGVSPERTAMVGDGLPDVAMAQAVPCTAIAAAWGYVDADRLRAQKPTYVATDPFDAATILLPAAKGRR